MNVLTLMCFVASVLAVTSALPPPSRTFAQEYIVQQMQKTSVTGKSKLGLYGFSFNDCSAPSAPLKGNVTLSPTSPVTLPGKLTVSFNASFGVTLKTPLKLVLKIEKKEFIWIDIPCVDNIGSCTYDDICSMIPPTPSSGCPPPLKAAGLPCACPFQQGKYSLKPTVLEIESLPSGIPDFLADGDFKVNAKLFDGNNELGCVDLAFTLKLNN
ncbi:ganglioside GM2 activator-like [Asterias amurensis]|uniref:ganglioside GM2 activator-like n=1 Tax=Asterias amurensis TaxID=7602 RepID=UPI003AB15AF6